MIINKKINKNNINKYKKSIFIKFLLQNNQNYIKIL